MKHILSYNNQDFLMNGEKFTILSGAIHYFRVVPEYWEDRLKKLKACGFNTVETYTCWNLHERSEGSFDFTGMLDIEQFIKIAEKVGLYVIVRPGPFICAEWELGGLPSWLLKYKNMRIRCNDPLYLEKVTNYFNELLKYIVPHLSTNGGNVIAMQIENEYGSYGNDKDYLNAIKEIYQNNGVDCLMFTSDGPDVLMLNGGTLEGQLATANFGSRTKEAFDSLKKFRPNQPLMCCEFWNGWFDHWHAEHHTRDAKDAANTLDEMLQMGGSVNLYMFHGGTNFGFTNGANFHDVYAPTITSYDYDSPLNECGDLTEKYFLFKEVLEKHFGKAPELEVHNLPKKAYGKVALNQYADLFTNLDQLSKPVKSAYPLTMEDLDQNFGFILYSTTLKGPIDEQELEIVGLHDRAHIFVNGEFKGIKERTKKRWDKITLALDAGEEVMIDILVENMGRVNYGPKIYDSKGIVNGVKIGYQYIFGWTMRSLPCEDLSTLNFTDIKPDNNNPTFLKGTFTVDEKADTFLHLDAFSKGIAFVNGFNLGRYFNTAGPQKSLYVPAPLLKQGENELIIFELDSYSDNSVELKNEMNLG